MPGHDPARESSRLHYPGNNDHASRRSPCRRILQMVFEPGHCFGVEMVGRLIQQQDIGLFEQKTAQGHTRRSPPERTLTVYPRADSAAHPWPFRAGIQVPGIECIESLLHLALALHELVHLIIGHGFGKILVDRIEFSQVNRLLHAFFNDFPRSFQSSSTGSCSRKPMV